ncbi:MAG TPA: hypothetical protein VFB42_06910 [Gaiellaceae bacterium]|nr:hypothetical protein [Gaiellaceae bacterium]
MDWTAIATLILAAFTALLVLATFWLARQGGDDVRAQWRPVLLLRTNRPADIAPKRGEPIPLSQYVAPRPLIDFKNNDDGTYAVTLLVENVGRGPALEVRPWMDQPNGAQAVGSGEQAAAGEYTAMAPGELTWFTWSRLTIPDLATGSFSYTDISTVTHRTSFIIDPSGSNLVWQNVESFGVFKLAWWHAIVPRPLRKHLRPLTRRYLRRRYRIDLPG